MTKLETTIYCIMQCHYTHEWILIDVYFTRTGDISEGVTPLRSIAKYSSSLIIISIHVTRASSSDPLQWQRNLPFRVISRYSTSVQLIMLHLKVAAHARSGLISWELFKNTPQVSDGLPLIRCTLQCNWELGLFWKHSNRTRRPTPHYHLIIPTRCGYYNPC